MFWDNLQEIRVHLGMSEEAFGSTVITISVGILGFIAKSIYDFLLRNLERANIRKQARKYAHRLSEEMEERGHLYCNFVKEFFVDDRYKIIYNTDLKSLIAVEQFKSLGLDKLRDAFNNVWFDLIKSKSDELFYDTLLAAIIFAEGKHLDFQKKHLSFFEEYREYNNVRHKHYLLIHSMCERIRRKPTDEDSVEVVTILKGLYRISNDYEKDSKKAYPETIHKYYYKELRQLYSIKPDFFDSDFNSTLHNFSQHHKHYQNFIFARRYRFKFIAVQYLRWHRRLVDSIN